MSIRFIGKYINNKKNIFYVFIDIDVCWDDGYKHIVYETSFLFYFLILFALVGRCTCGHEGVRNCYEFKFDMS